jgi:hypothetical protein
VNTEFLGLVNNAIAVSMADVIVSGIVDENKSISLIQLETDGMKTVKLKIASLLNLFFTHQFSYRVAVISGRFVEAIARPT